jgi:hypothetical protein
MTSCTYLPGLKYRATLCDGDTTRERPLTIYGNSLEEIERWAEQVIPKALDGGAVNVYQNIEQHVKLIPKKRVEEVKP